MSMRLTKCLLIALLALPQAAAAVTADQAWDAQRRAAFTTFKRQAAKPATPKTLWDGAPFPEMVVVPAGTFLMGSPLDEANRHADEGPQHPVHIARPFAVSKYPVTVGEFARFVAATHYDAGDTCKTFENGAWDDHRAGRNWRNPGYRQTLNDPVVCMNFDDGQAYAAWLSRKTGHHYRLLSEAEYEYVNRAGTRTPWWWGNDIGGNHANCSACGNDVAHDGTVPVGSYAPNAFGLYDTSGNAWSWVADCWQAGYDGAPDDGTPFTGGACTEHAERGGAWYYTPGSLRSAIRVRDKTGLRNYHNGFRLARTL
ncbi:MAG TPA: formylglycine-generating enzyme family protein [Novosphingobium sp.]|nr:formylglycine-generating enzyme family protein [Novosphingobium sp.]